jgi:transposase InsO family protein
MSESHSHPPKPSPLLALIALALVHRFRPSWCAISLSDAARGEGVRAERLSRLASRAASAFEAVVARMISIGRPVHDRQSDALGTELAITQSLLGVAAAMLGAIAPWRKPIARNIIVSAWLRLKAAHPELTQTTFASALALSTRTLRAWLSRRPGSPPKPQRLPPATKPKKKKKRKRGERRPRFRFDVHVPKLQFAGDTTDLEVFGVPLKLIGVQDVGGRDQSLLDSVIIDDHESAELVVDAATRALRDLPGAQFLTDQGTVYMAQRTREALADLEIEHAPQKEGDPTGKATLERAFGVIKPIVAPILNLTRRMATAIPQLAQEEIAKASARLIITAVLRAYQAGARATTRAFAARAKHSAESLERMAASAREDARAQDRSSRLTLEHIHDIYIRRDEPKPRAQRSRKRFVDSLRKYPVVVLQEAERRFRSQVHRSDIRDRASYFAKLARDVNDAHKKRRDRERSNDARRDKVRDEMAQVREADAVNADDPITWLRKGLDLVSLQWISTTKTLLAAGAGLGVVHLRGAIAALLAQHGSITTIDIATSVLREFTIAREADLGTAGITAIRQLLERLLPRAPEYERNTHFAPPLALDILIGAGKNGHSQPSNLLST